MRTMIAVMLGGALTLGFGGFALAARPPLAGVVPPAPAFVRIASASGVQVADNDGEEHGHWENHEEHHGEKHWEHHEDKHHVSEEERERSYAGPFFRPAYTRYFRDCYGGSARNLPPGLQKQVERTGHLPPGLQKHLERDGTLPPGLEKRMTPANPCLMRHIGPLPVGERLYMLGRDAYLINYHTQRIIDILRNAF